jgi:hypothetical protein
VRPVVAGGKENALRWGRSHCCTPGIELRSALSEELRPRFAVRRSCCFGSLPLIAAELHDTLRVCTARSSEEHPGY